MFRNKMNLKIFVNDEDEYYDYIKIDDVEYDDFGKCEEKRSFFERWFICS